MLDACFYTTFRVQATSVHYKEDPLIVRKYQKLFFQTLLWSDKYVELPTLELDCFFICVAVRFTKMLNSLSSTFHSRLWEPMLYPILCPVLLMENHVVNDYAEIIIVKMY